MVNSKKEIKMSINNNLSNFISFDHIESSHIPSNHSKSPKDIIEINTQNEFSIFCDDDGFKITCQKNRHTLLRAENQWEKKQNAKNSKFNDINEQKKYNSRDINLSFMKNLVFDQFDHHKKNVDHKKDENQRINSLSDSLSQYSDTYSDSFNSMPTTNSLDFNSLDFDSLDTDSLDTESLDTDSLDTNSSDTTESFKFSSALSFINFGSKINKKNEKCSNHIERKQTDVTEDEKTRYLKHMDNIVEQIKNLSWGNMITVDPEPQFISLNKKKMCYITKIVRFSTYEFRGYGSKKILRYFMKKTADDPIHGYQKIIQILTENSRTFLPIKNWTDFWKAYEDEPIKDRHLFELIRSDQPCKPYLDIEWYIKEKEIDQYEFINTLIPDLINIFKKRYSIGIAKKDIMIATAHSDTKTSFHVVIDKVIDGKTVGYKTNCRGFADSAWDLWIALIEHNSMYKDVIDKSVYSTDREFRAIYSNKGADFRPFIPFDFKKTKKNIKPESFIETESSNCLRYIITYSPNNQYHHIETPDVSTKYTVINKKNYEHEFIPQFYTDKKVNELIDLIKPIHPTVAYTGRSTCGTGWRFSYANKNESCYTGNIHDSNGFYVFENNAKGIIYMKCMSNNCKGYRILKKYNVKNVIDKKLF